MRWFKPKISLENFIDPKIYKYLTNIPSRQNLHGEEVSLSIMHIGFFISSLSDTRIKDFVQFYADSINLLLDRGATIVMNSGATILSYYNHPEPRKDHVIEACETSFDLINFRDKSLKELKIRIGITTGHALVGIVGSEKLKSPTVIGDNVALAEEIVYLSGMDEVEIIVSQHVKEIVDNVYLLKKLTDIKIPIFNVGLFQLIKRET